MLQQWYVVGVGSVGVGLGSIACGPSIAIDGDDGAGTTGNPSTDHGTSGGGPPVTTVADATTAMASTTGVDPSSDGATSNDEGDVSTGDPYECGCPENTPIGLEDTLPDGETVSQLLTHFQDVDLPLTWLEGFGTTTTVHLDVQYRGGPIELGPGGDDGCLFLSAPCPDGVQMTVMLTVTSDDGWLNLSTPAELYGYGTTADLFGLPVDIADNDGTLAEQPLVIAGVPLTIKRLKTGLQRTTLTPSGYTGLLLADVSGEGCGTMCEGDADCSGEMKCIGRTCFDDTCGDQEVIAEF